MPTDAAPSDRRRFLKLGLLGTAAVFVSGGALRWFALGYRQQLSGDDEAIGLSVKELAVARALVEALLPAEDGFPSGISLRVHQRIDEEVWSADEALGRDIRDGLQLIEHATLAYGFSARFTSLGVDARRAYFEKLLTSKNETLRFLAVGLRQMVHLFYYGHPDAWSAISYPGPLVKDPSPPESSRWYAELHKSGGRNQ